MPHVKRELGTPSAAVENIATILSLEDATLRERTPAGRLFDGIASFVGTPGFVLAQVCAVAAWVVINTGLVRLIPAFDPFPFPLLSSAISTEGVLLSAFVLIKQNRMSYIAERRNHLDLQINLLTEREVTRLLQITDRLARHVGVELEPKDDLCHELAQETRVDKLMEELDKKLSEPS
jgi:uncharacterized membrane protein